jgi:nicotinate phosphoribosyltransferase
MNAETIVATGVPYGPLRESGELTAGLDYYKPTMSQLAFEQEPDAEVTFTFKNRGEQRLLDHVDPIGLQERFDQLRERRFNQRELGFFAAITSSEGERVFSDDYLEYLQTNELPRVKVLYDDELNDIAIESTGPWALTTFWETIVMSEVNEAYFEGYMLGHGLNPLEVYEEGDRRLTEKIEMLKEHPEIQFVDFGTRRHFSLRWQMHVVDRLMQECPENFAGTSNVGLAKHFDTQPIGTYAHEMPMGYAGLADARGEDIRGSHNTFLQAWYRRYGKDYAVALPDTFTSDFFFADFTPEQAENWRGARHDSGDPIDFGEQLISFYEQNYVDPTTKTLTFSDGLDLDTILKLQEHFEGRIKLVYGWGTTLTNDLGVPALNIVMKLTHIKTVEGYEADTVKLSDNPGKHTGPEALVHTYANEYFAIT